MTSRNIDLAFLKRYFARDTFAAHCGIELVEAADGRAAALVRLDDRHVNGIGLVHGGLLFTLADLAFAAAAHTRGQVSVSASSTISYIKAAQGKVIRAQAREVTRNRRLGSYTVDLLDETGEIVAVFQGLAYFKREAVTDACS